MPQNYPTKKSDFSNRQPRKARHRKGNNYKKTTSQSTFIGGTDELGTDTFTYGATIGNDCMNSKETLIAYGTIKYGTNIRESLKKSKIAAYNTNSAPSYIPMDKEGKAASITALKKWCYLYRKHHSDEEVVKENMVKLYEILWKQYDEILRNKMKADKKFEKVETNRM